MTSTKINKLHKQTDKYPLAVQFFRDGKLSKAQEILLSLLNKNKRDFDALNFLGIIQITQGNFEKAIEYFRQVVSIIANHPTAHYNLGLCCQQLNRIDEAIEHYLDSFKINSNHTDTLNNLGIIYFNKLNFPEAEKYYLSALKVEPANDNVLNNLGNLYSMQNKFEEAEKYYSKAIVLSSNNPDYRYNYSDCLIKQDKFEEAQTALESTLQMKQDHVAALNSLGLVYTKLNMYERAVNTYQKLIEIKGRTNDILVKLSDLYLELGDYENAESCLQDLMNDYSGKLIAYTNLGALKLRQGRIDESICFSQKALAENDQIALAHYNYAYALLLKGNFNEGWQEYEWRKKVDGFEKRFFSGPELTERNIGGKRILVCDEQGLGDSIQFVRLLPKLKELGAYVILECNKRLAGLFKNLSGVDEIIVKSGNNEPEIEYDFHISLLSIPRFLK